jgi:hypothetical protein
LGKLNGIGLVAKLYLMLEHGMRTFPAAKVPKMDVRNSRRKTIVSILAPVLTGAFQPQIRTANVKWFT